VNTPQEAIKQAVREQRRAILRATASAARPQSARATSMAELPPVELVRLAQARPANSARRGERAAATGRSVRARDGIAAAATH